MISARCVRTYRERQRERATFDTQSFQFRVDSDFQLDVRIVLSSELIQQDFETSEALVAFR